MNVALIGYSQSGRSTLYRAAAQGKAKGDVTAVPVPDPRFDAIVAQVKPKKATPATVILADDVDPISPSGRAFSLKLLDQAKKADLLLHVVRAFDSPAAPYHATVDPIRDQEAVEVELVLSDLQIVENRLARLQKSMALKPGSPEYMEHALFERIKEPLENGQPLRNMELLDEETAILRNYQFLSFKPMVVVFNVGEAEAAGTTALQPQIDKLHAAGTPAFAASAEIEEEIAQLEPADQKEFLESLGLEEPASHRVIRAVYEAMGLITFFTAGENDTHAWTVRHGATALKAAATVHNEIAKGFIRAEVVHYADYAAAGSLDAAYHQNKMHLEGKEHVIEDGDLIHIRNKS